MPRPVRCVAKPDYKTLHKGIPSDESMEDSSASEGEGEPMDDSLEEGELDEEERWEQEDPEPWLQLSDVEFDEKFDQAKLEGDVFQLEFLLKVKEQRCAELKKALLDSEVEKKKKEKKKKLREIESKFKKLKQQESVLTRSLVESRSCTPNAMPLKDASRGKGLTALVSKRLDRKKKVVSTKKKPREAARRSGDFQMRKLMPDREKGERNQKSFLDKRGQFTELLNQALVANSKVGVDERLPYMPNFDNIWPTNTDHVNSNKECGGDLNFPPAILRLANLSSRMVVNACQSEMPKAITIVNCVIAFSINMLMRLHKALSMLIVLRDKRS